MRTPIGCPSRFFRELGRLAVEPGFSGRLSSFASSVPAPPSLRRTGSPQAVACAAGRTYARQASTQHTEWCAASKSHALVLRRKQRAPRACRHCPGMAPGISVRSQSLAATVFSDPISAYGTPERLASSVRRDCSLMLPSCCVRSANLLSL